MKRSLLLAAALTLMGGTAWAQGYSQEFLHGYLAKSRKKAPAVRGARGSTKTRSAHVRRKRPKRPSRYIETGGASVQKAFPKRPSRYVETGGASVQYAKKKRLRATRPTASPRWFHYDGNHQDLTGARGNHGGMFMRTAAPSTSHRSPRRQVRRGGTAPTRASRAAGRSHRRRRAKARR